MSENSLIQELIKIRKSQNISQAELASRADLKQQTISKAEGKDGNPNLKTLCSMLDALGYKIEFTLKSNDDFVINDNNGDNENESKLITIEDDDCEIIKFDGISIDIDDKEDHIETYEDENDTSNACSNCTYYKIAYPLGRCANPNHTMIGKYKM